MKYLFFLIPALTFAIFCSVTTNGQETQKEQKSFKLALCQMKVVGGNRAVNLTHAGDMIAEAARNGADLILLPEAMDLGWTDPSALTEAEPVPEGKTCAFLACLLYTSDAADDTSEV